MTSRGSPTQARRAHRARAGPPGGRPHAGAGALVSRTRRVRRCRRRAARSTASSEAFDRWRDLFTAAEQQRDAARRTMDDYAAPPAREAGRAEPPRAGHRPAQPAAAGHEHARRATSTPTATSRPRASCRATTSRACRSWPTCRRRATAAARQPTCSARASSRSRSSGRAASSTTRAAPTASCARCSRSAPRCRRTPDARLPTQTVRICRACGAGHFDDDASLCHACGASLGDAEIVNQRLSHRERGHAAGRAHHRQRRGAPAPGLRAADDVRVGGSRPASSTCAVAPPADDEPARSCGWPTVPGATITRLNKGLRRRANSTQLGFRIDPVSGYWAKNEDEAGRDRRSRPRHRDSGSCRASRTARTRCCSSPSDDASLAADRSPRCSTRCCAASRPCSSSKRARSSPSRCRHGTSATASCSTRPPRAAPACSRAWSPSRSARRGGPPGAAHHALRRRRPACLPDARTTSPTCRTPRASPPAIAA